jgi:flagellar biosynthesis protein FlhG
MQASETRLDQATGLRQIRHPRPVRVIAVTSGKGGVGKSTVTVNLAVALALENRQVMILDADLGLANIDVLLGLHPAYNLSHVLSGQRLLEEIIVLGPKGIKIVPGASGIQKMAMLSPAQHAGLIRSFGEVGCDLDFMLVDTSAGITDSVVTFSRAAQEVIVVVCDEPASITDAYALIKLLSRDYGVQRFHIVTNMVRSAVHGRELYEKFARVTGRFLDVVLDFMGAIPNNDYFRKAAQKQRALIDAFPSSSGAVAFEHLAECMEQRPVPTTASGHLEFFVERLIRFGANHSV